MFHIAKGIKKIKRPQFTTIYLYQGDIPYLSVCENGETRLLKISKQVAEVLIARGMSYSI